MNKILYVINADWYFELHWLERALYFKSLGYIIHVAFPIQDVVILKRLKDLGFVIHPISIKRTSMSILNEYKVLIELKEIIKNAKPSLIHSVTIKPNLYSTILCRFNRIALVSTYPGLGTLGVSEELKYTLSRKIIFIILKLFSKSQNNYALFENEEDLQLFKFNNVIPFNRLERVFGAGINLDEFSYCSPSTKKGQLTVLFASRLLKNKGLSLLFEAVEQLNVKGLNVKLIVAGIFDHDSPFAYTEDEIKYFAEFPFVEWLGKRSDIKNLIEMSDVVCLPTTYGEGVPRILIESCAVGRPIITTPLGGCKDICKDSYNGFLVQPDSINAIVNALCKFVDNQSIIESMGINGRKLVESKFANQSVFQQHFDLYRSTLSIES
ncbi:glycosyltransferase family 4 protein [Shewanella sp. ALD9]|uniref:glycosyltransferase family 4 protein n=1 Tax=Shewanella sp. ALD9 TaxID=2058330 RepID=UPI000C3295D9|nr:glycosyltransferase family 4 protein [Shewanella sp. ALD9]PKH31899.1 glycosyltransferase family 1 protein [Shewanella sp. ALD9]